MGPARSKLLPSMTPLAPQFAWDRGDSPTWSPDGATILGILPSPAGSSVVAYAPGGQATIPFGFSIDGPISSLAWTSAGLPGEAYAAGLDPSGAIAAATETPSASSIRLDLASLPGVAAPRALLVGGAASAFEGLYARVARDSGWDFLSVLDNAFVGLNDPLPPGFAFEDWLYTGRAFAFAQAAYNAGWVEVVREDFGGETYWRIFVRANRQDGSQGEPLRLRPWDYSVRYTGDPAAYDAGGGLRGTTPSGYYVDFTQLAADQGFRRLPAMANWRTFFPGARFSEFARTDGLTWMDAMLQIYPRVGDRDADAVPDSDPHADLHARSHRDPLVVGVADADAQPNPNFRADPDALTRNCVLHFALVTFVGLTASCGPRLPATPIAEPTGVVSSTEGIPGPASTEQPPVDQPGAPAPTPMRYAFPTPGPDPVSAWRPPPYAVPLAIRPEDHFYFLRPIPSGNVNWPHPLYRYGNTFFGEESIHTGVDLDAPRGTPVLAAAAAR